MPSLVFAQEADRRRVFLASLMFYPALGVLHRFIISLSHTSLLLSSASLFPPLIISLPHPLLLHGHPPHSLRLSLVGMCLVISSASPPRPSFASYSGLICNCSSRASFEEVDDEEDDGSNCK